MLFSALAEMFFSLRATALSGPYFGGGFFYVGMSNIRQILI
jgi:hypothetical protein